MSKQPSKSFTEVLILSLTEIFGEEETEAIKKRLDLVSGQGKKYGFLHDYDLMQQLGDLLAKKYDALTAKGLLVRLGRASLTYIRRFYTDISKLGDIDNRLKPIDRRFLFSLNTLGARMEDAFGMEISVNKVQTREFRWSYDAAERNDRDHIFIPYFYFGLLEEFCYWLDARKEYQICYQETEGVDDSAISIVIKGLE